MADLCNITPLVTGRQDWAEVVLPLGISTGLRQAMRLDQVHLDAVSRPSHCRNHPLMDASTAM